MKTFNENCVNDHTGTHYSTILSWIHELALPRLYFEIGTLTGGTLALSHCESVAVDPQFQLQGNGAIASKEIVHLFQMTSDNFFAKHSFGFKGKIDFAFLDGLHHCEFLLRDFYNTERCASNGAIITMHDCLPLDIPMTCRDQFGFQSAMPHRNGWWTGDVWRVVAALKKFRPDLKVTCLDAQETGLVVITGLNPHSRVLPDQYEEALNFMYSLDLNKLTVEKMFADFAVRHTPPKDSLLGTLF